MEPQEHDCPDGCCPNCDCEVCMDVLEMSNNIIRYICPTCGHFEDFDDSPLDEKDITLVLPPYEG